MCYGSDLVILRDANVDLEFKGNMKSQNQNKNKKIRRAVQGKGIVENLFSRLWCEKWLYSLWHVPNFRIFFASFTKTFFLVILFYVYRIFSHINSHPFMCALYDYNFDIWPCVYIYQYVRIVYIHIIYNITLYIWMDNMCSIYIYIYIHCRWSRFYYQLVLMKCSCGWHLSVHSNVL